MLEDIILAAEIVGKRVRYRIYGSKIMKVKITTINSTLTPAICGNLKVSYYVFLNYHILIDNVY